MKAIILFFCLFANAVMAYSQQPALDSANFDRIIRYNGEILIVAVKGEGDRNVQFTYPLNKVINYLPYSQIKELRYKNGTVKIFEEPVVKKPVKDSLGLESAWKKVVVTYNKEDVEGMFELGPVESQLEADQMNTSNELLERNAIFFIRKKAGRMGAKKVLIISTEFNAAYGDIPIITMKAIAYGSENLPVKSSSPE